MHIINKNPNFIVFKQEPIWDKEKSCLIIDVYSLYSEISLFTKFDYCIDMQNAFIIDNVNCKVKSILIHEKESEFLMPHQSAKIILEFENIPFKIIERIRNEEISFGLIKDRDSSIYISELINIVPVYNNKQVLTFLGHRDQNIPDDYVCYVARSMKGNINIKQHFDLVWELKPNPEFKNCNFSLEVIYNNLNQRQNLLFEMRPAIIFLKVDPISILEQQNHISYGHELMLGKRIELIKDYPI
ncbi:MAG: hypothetical protein KA010_01735 [Saprospiraceae bacterium]|nr:hypothetical protein [Saprospiraceae bacterium]